MCRVLAAGVQARVLSVGYKLAPEATPARQIEEVAAVCHWVGSAAGEGAIGAATSIALAGDSSGAYVLVNVAVRLNAERRGAVSLQVLLYPLLHLDDRGWSRPRARDLRFIGRIGAGVIRRYPGQTPASLLDLDLSLAPPTIIATGGLDPTTSDATLLADRFRSQGAAVDLIRFQYLPHGSFNATYVSNAAHQALINVAELAAVRLSPVKGERPPT